MLLCVQVRKLGIVSLPLMAVRRIGTQFAASFQGQPRGAPAFFRDFDQFVRIPRRKNGRLAQASCGGESWHSQYRGSRHGLAYTVTGPAQSNAFHHHERLTLGMGVRAKGLGVLSP